MSLRGDDELKGGELETEQKAKHSSVHKPCALTAYRCISMKQIIIIEKLLYFKKSEKVWNPSDLSSVGKFPQSDGLGSQFVRMAAFTETLVSFFQRGSPPAHTARCINTRFRNHGITVLN